MWDLIKPGLELVRKRSGNWRCEDIYVAIKTGKSGLYLADPEEYEGFVVVTLLTTLTGKSLEITAAYSKSLRKITDYIPDLERMAKNMGAQELVLSSTRNWGKYFTPRYTVYSREIYG